MPGAGVLDGGQGFDRAAVVVPADAFVMGNQDRDARFPADPDRFLDGIGDVVGLVAHMGGVKGTVFVEALQDIDYLFGRRFPGGRIKQAGRKSGGASLHAATEAVAHRLDLVAGCGPVQPVHCRQTKGRVTDLADGVDRSGFLVESIQVAGEAGVKVLRIARQQIDRRWRTPVDLQRRNADTAIACHDRGDALTDFEIHVRGCQ